VPIPNIAVKWLPCGCHKLHRTVYTYSKTNSGRKKNRNLFFFHIWQRVKRLFGLWRLTDLAFCCKMAPLRQPEVASNRFLAGKHKYSSKTNNNLPRSHLYCSGEHSIIKDSVPSVSVAPQIHAYFVAAYQSPILTQHGSLAAAKCCVHTFSGIL
jgi:hypothetical protein